MYALIRKILCRRAEAFYRRVAHSEQEQQRLFQRMLPLAAPSAWGAFYSLSPTMSYADFQQAIPVTDYDGLYPWIERTLQGEADVLRKGNIRLFAQSSGTSSRRSKFLPVTTDGMQENHIRAATDLTAAYYFSTPGAKLLPGKLMSVGGSYQVNPQTGIISGDISALITLNTPWYIRTFRKPPLAVAQLSHWEEKLEAYAEALIGEDIRTIAGVPSWTYLILQQVLLRSGKKTIQEVWPRIELFFHGGVSYGPYREKFRTLMGKDIATRNCYNASEGFFAFQPDEQPGMLLLTHHGVFYEFISFADYQQQQYQAIPLAEVELHCDYVLVISTLSGIYRYMPGDVLRFISRRPYRLELSGRTRSCLNLFGEEVMEHQLDAAIGEACRQTGAMLHDYTIVAELFANGRGRHCWYIEFDRQPTRLDVFRTILDKELAEKNADYQVKRSGSLLLQQPGIEVLQAGAVYRWFESRGKLGGQHKLPRVMGAEEAKGLMV
jgi:hypothetical protein